MNQKFCPDCNRYRDVDAFARKCTAADGLQTYCKIHAAIRLANWRERRAAKEGAEYRRRQPAPLMHLPAVSTAAVRLLPWLDFKGGYAPDSMCFRCPLLEPCHADMKAAYDAACGQPGYFNSHQPLAYCEPHHPRRPEWLEWKGREPD